MKDESEQLTDGSNTAGIHPICSVIRVDIPGTYKCVVCVLSFWKAEHSLRQELHTFKAERTTKINSIESGYLVDISESAVALLGLAHIISSDGFSPSIFKLSQFLLRNELFLLVLTLQQMLKLGLCKVHS